MCGDGSPTSYETTMRAPKLPNPPSVALEDVLVPAISALSTLALIMILASAAIVLVQTWNGFCGGRRDGGEDGYLDNNDRRALTQLSLRYCKIILYYTIRIRDYKSDKKKQHSRTSELSRTPSPMPPPMPMATTNFVAQLDTNSAELELERARRQNLSNTFKETVFSC